MMLTEFESGKLKNTSRKKSIISLLEKSDQPISAEAIYLKLSEQNVSVNLSTVYRILNSLSANGLILKNFVSDENKALYEINHSEHIHHFICINCKKMINIAGCPFSNFEKELNQSTDFEITGHKLELYGYCANCKRGR